MSQDFTFSTEHITPGKKAVMDFMDKRAGKRDRFYRWNRYYHKEMIRFFRFSIHQGRSVLEIGCSTGNTLAALHPSKGVGIDISKKMVETARDQHNDLQFFQMDAERIQLDQTFDHVVISDSLGYFEDVQRVFAETRKVMTADSRLVITYHSFVWQPLLNLLEFCGLKMPQMLLNWLNPTDIKNLLKLERFEVIRSGRRTLLPFYIPILSFIINRFLAYMPIFNWFCLSNYIVARPLPDTEEIAARSVSIVVPARNEKGNIQDAIDRIPNMGTFTEVIFVEGGSSDGTMEEIERCIANYDGVLR